MNKKLYLAPTLEVERFFAEQGFSLSLEGGIDGPSYGEEEVEW